MRTASWVLTLLSVVVLAGNAAARKDRNPSRVPTVASNVTDTSVRVQAGLAAYQFAILAANTTVLYAEDFDEGGSCTTAGWTEVDLTAQIAEFFHIDDYAGLSFGPVRGTKSLWCGARPSVAYCAYATLPGYGNNWDQGFCTKACLNYAGTVAVDYLARWDTEPMYDFVCLEYSTECAGFGDWESLVRFDGIGDSFRHDTFAAPAVPVKIRIRFFADVGWSDEDGMFSTDGAVHIDSLSVGDATGVRVSVEDFEDEGLGATSSNDWETCSKPGYGSFAFVTRGWGVLQLDPCARDLSCLWAFFEDSPQTYACGGYPNQKAVPRGNSLHQYLTNEVWSPAIPVAGTGSNARLDFSVYRDLDLDGLVFYTWHVRSRVDGCWGGWRDRRFVYFGDAKDWFAVSQSVGDLLNLDQASHIQIALGAVDLCGAWCGLGVQCHSNAPLFDNVRLLRFDGPHPQWTIRDIDQFQDNFSTDGTIAGTVRADAALDIRPASNPSIVPGDSCVVTVSDPEAGLADDVVLGGKKVFAYVAVRPLGQPAKAGAALSGGPRWPFAGLYAVDGVVWTVLRLDACRFVNGNPIANKFCIDLNDDLFIPGDSVFFFYCAENGAGQRTYATGSSLERQTSDFGEAATLAAEFTCLPAEGDRPDADLLYVDGMDGRGAQPFWDTALQQLGIFDGVDRYDIRGPSSGVGNRPGSRVENAVTQLIGADVYRGIMWDCGDLSVGLGAGFGQPGEKSDDYSTLNTFLDNLNQEGGVYICGDDVFQQLRVFYSPSAVTFKTTYLTFTLTTGNHAASFGVSPLGHGTAGYFHDDKLVIFGGCPLINDFDVAAPTGSSVMEVSYGPQTASNGAVISKATMNSNAVEAHVMMSGYSFIYVRDDVPWGSLDRADHLHDIVVFLHQAGVINPVGVEPITRNSLSQNYPNPFNPQTTIAFTLKQRGDVTLKIYNAAGELVRTLASESFAAGPHTKVWNGRNDVGESVASGVYFYRLVTSGFEQTKKMVLLK